MVLVPVGRMLDRTTGLPDKYRMLKRCRTKLSDEDIAKITMEMTKLESKILRQRVLYDEKDFKNIPIACNRPSRDHLKGVYRKGYMFLTDPMLVVDDKLIATAPLMLPVEVEHVAEDTLVEEAVVEVVEVVVENKKRERKRKTFFDD